jgi:hypothetical protein
MTDNTETPEAPETNASKSENHWSGLLDIPLEFTELETSGSLDQFESDPELSFRRGFVHGAYAALFLHLSGVHAQRVRNWVMGDLTRWREKGLQERIRTGRVTRNPPPVARP